MAEGLGRNCGRQAGAAFIPRMEATDSRAGVTCTPLWRQIVSRACSRFSVYHSFRTDQMTAAHHSLGSLGHESFCHSLCEKDLARETSGIGRRGGICAVVRGSISTPQPKRQNFLQCGNCYYMPVRALCPACWAVVPSYTDSLAQIPEGVRCRQICGKFCD